MADKSVSIDLIIKSSEAASSLKEVKQSLKDIKDAMIGAGEGTPEFLKLAAAASELKAKVDDSNEAINAINPNKFQAVATFAASAAGGISAVTGAMGLFGAESEEVTKTLAKVQSAMALSQGLAALSELPKTWNNLKAAMASTALVQKIVTAGQWLWNAAMMANPIGLLVAGVAALIGGIYLLVGALGSEDSANKKNIETLDRLQKAREGNIEKIEHELKLKKILGLTGRDALVEDLKATNDKIKLLEDESWAYRNVTERTKEMREAEVERHKEIKKLRNEAQLQFASISKFEQDETKKANDDAKKTADDKKTKAEADAKARYDARVSETKALAELNKSSNDEERIRLTTNEIKELKIIEGMAERDLQIKFDKSTKDAEAVKSFNAVILNLREKLGFDIEAIEKKFQDATIKAEEEAELRLAKTWQEKLNIVFKRQQAELESQLKANSNNVIITAELNEQIRLNKEKHIFELENLDKADREKKFADLLTDQEKIITDSETSLSLKLDALNIENAAIKLNQDLTDEERIKKLQENEDRAVAITKKANLDKLNSGLDLAKQGLASIQAVTDVAFEAKLKKVKKGSKEEEKLMRQQFALNKKMQLAGAIVDGAKAVLTSLAMSPVAIGVVPNPVGIASLAFTVAASLANVVKIASTQFEGGGGGGGGGMNTPDINASAATATSNSQPSTLLNPDGTVANNTTPTPAPIQVYVVESDITSTQTQVAVVQNQMNFH